MRALNCLLRRRAELHGDAEAPDVEPPRVVEVAPAEIQRDVGTVRLDDEGMDDRIALLQLTIADHDRCLAVCGPEDPTTMVAISWLAHAHAALDQMDSQVDEGWRLASDAAEGLAELLGPDAPDALMADRVRTWIGGLDRGA